MTACGVGWQKRGPRALTLVRILDEIMQVIDRPPQGNVSANLVPQPGEDTRRPWVVLWRGAGHRDFRSDSGAFVLCVLPLGFRIRLG